jgi:hypothetical protein
LTAIALEKTGEEHDKIVFALGKILMECFDETYDVIGEDAELLSNFVRLGIVYGLRRLAVALARLGGYFVAYNMRHTVCGIRAKSPSLSRAS